MVLCFLARAENLTSGVYQQKANMALQYTVAIRDKALEAYKEIMNMQV